LSRKSLNSASSPDGTIDGGAPRKFVIDPHGLLKAA
jgi:hypothetical protein